jgi:hypothetical protein
VVVTGGHAPAQAPLQLDMGPVSFTHRYTARPEALVKTVPAEDFAVVMTVPPEELAPALGEDAAGADEAGADEAGAAGAAALLLAALLHAATTTAAPSAPPTPAASLARLETRLNLDLTIVFISRPARLAAPASRNSLSVELRAERWKGLFVDDSTKYELGHYLAT